MNVTTEITLIRDEREVRVVVSANCYSNGWIGKGNERRMEPHDLENIRAVTLDGTELELSPDEEDAACEAIGQQACF